MQATQVSTVIHSSRPAFLLLTPCCLSVAFAFAIAEHVAIDGLTTITILLGALSAHISVNLLNEYQDFTSGLDLQTSRTAFSGGSGALPKSPQFAGNVRFCGLLCLAVTLLIGLYFVWTVGWGLFPLGLAGVLLVFFYTPQITRHPLLCLLAPGLGFGPLMILGAYFLLSGHFNSTVLATSFIVMLAVSNLLLLNQFPDVEADQKAGRLHLPIAIGRQKATVLYSILSLASYLLLLQAIYLGLLPIYCLLGMLTLLSAIPAAVLTIRYHDDTVRLVPALGLNVITTLCLPLLISLGLIWPLF